MKTVTEKGNFIIDVNYGLCNNCGACVAVCPEDVLHLGTLMLSADNGRCSGCKWCIITCPADALKLLDVSGNRLTFESVDG